MKNSPEALILPARIILARPQLVFTILYVLIVGIGVSAIAVVLNEPTVVH
jgi:hypothetical protein